MYSMGYIANVLYHVIASASASASASWGVCVLCSVMCLLSIVSCYALIVSCRLSIVDGFRTVDSRGYLQPRLGSGQGGLSLYHCC